MAIAADTPIGERRSARRVPVRRKAVIICAEGAVPHVTGTAVDMSCDGMGIRVHRPLTRGQTVDIELEPQEGKPQAEEIRVRGQVARVQSTGAHDCVLGVSFSNTKWPTVAIPAQGHLRLVEVPGPHQALPKISPPGQKKRTARAVPGVLLLLLLALLGLLWPGDTPKVRAARSLAASENTSAPEVMAPEEDKQDSKSPDETFASVPQLASPTLFHNTSHVTFTSVHGDYTLEMHPKIPGSAGPPVATALEGDGFPGRPMPLQEVLEGGDPGPVSTGDRPASSNTVARGGIDGDGAHGRSAEPPSRVLGESSQGVLLEVDRAAFLMRVYKDGRLAAEFPVGVGRDASTPLGEFTIANKIAKPAWYHRGETVPYGDPRNPLGESWMGFACDGVPMSYGIHPTDDAASIGAATGAGCVRMRPADAARLFRLCPRGATVRICDGPAAGRVSSAESQ
ncbi:MAG: L,D-transpeptidase family protein [Candidatus Hydrogenedentes bacterium]|nr:L,D-transpeptidase family protein [Candidatus Hydrogenedentota bacterium]